MTTPTGKAAYIKCHRIYSMESVAVRCGWEFVSLCVRTKRGSWKSGYFVGFNMIPLS